MKGVTFDSLPRSQPRLANEWHGVCPLAGHERSRRQVEMSDQGIILAPSTGFDRQPQIPQRKMIVAVLLITVLFAGAAFVGLWLIR